MPVVQAHGHHTQAEAEQGAEEHAEAVAEVALHGFDVVGRPGHQIAGAGLLEIAEGQGEQVGEIALADVALDAVRGGGQVPAHAEGHAPLRYSEDDDEGGVVR